MKFAFIVWLSLQGQQEVPISSQIIDTQPMCNLAKLILDAKIAQSDTPIMMKVHGASYRVECREIKIDG